MNTEERRRTAYRKETAENRALKARVERLNRLRMEYRQEFYKAAGELADIRTTADAKDQRMRRLHALEDAVRDNPALLPQAGFALRMWLDHPERVIPGDREALRALADMLESTDIAKLVRELPPRIVDEEEEEDE